MNGIIVIDKENGYTSFDVVAKMRRICGEKKIGHTGTLDPMATGVLPILIGNATKAQSLLPESDKEYEATFSFGITTDTLDITGKVLSQTESNVKSEDLETVLPQFRGDIMQLPPMYSAVSKDGVRLYELARKGLVTEREARPITVYKLDLLNFDEQLQSAKILVKCSKGTYIRTLCENIAEEMQTVGYMKELNRTRVGDFYIENSITIEQLEQSQYQIITIEQFFKDEEFINLTEKGLKLFLNGVQLTYHLVDGIYRIYQDDKFIGIGTIKNELLKRDIII